MKKPTIAKRQGEEPTLKKESKAPLEVLERERKNTSKADMNHNRIHQMPLNWKKHRLPTNYLQIQNDQKKKTPALNPPTADLHIWDPSQKTRAGGRE